MNFSRGSFQEVWSYMSYHKDRVHHWSGVVALTLLGSAVSVSSTSLASEAFPGGGFEAEVNRTLGLLESDVQRLTLLDLPGGQLELTLMIDNQLHRVRYEEHSNRTLTYQLLEQAPDGSLVEIPAGPVNTYRGTDANWPGMKSALSIEQDGFRVLLRAEDGEKWWVEPLNGRVRGAGPSDYAVYNNEDVITPEGFCGVKDDMVLPPLHLEQPGPLSGDRVVLSAQFVADTDFEYYQNYGSAAAVENRVNSLMNAINLQYENQVEIINELQAVVVRSDSSDPYSSNSIETRLNQVRSVWNATNNPTHDIVQLFSGASFTGSTIGLAFVGAVCSSFEYSVVESDCCGAFACATDLSAHELGHNWNAGHCSCPSNTMNPSLVCANNFSAGTISSITAFRNSIQSCLDSVEGACCTSNDACLVVSEALCANAGGEFLGAGTDCDGNPCIEPVQGACCLVSGTCVSNVTIDTCESANGIFQGEDTDCADVTCESNPEGACCLADDSCTQSFESDCLSSGGTFQGEGTDCDFVDCVDPDIAAADHAPVGANLLSIDQPNWTTSVYIVLDEGSRVDAVAGNALQNKLLTASSGFYQDPAGGPTSQSINPSFYDFVPDLEWDSRVTIGALDQTGNPFDGNALGDVGIDWTEFENGGSLSVDNGTWYILPTDEQGVAQPFIGSDCSQKYGVLVANVTALDLDSNVSFEAVIQGRDADGNTWQDSVSYVYSYSPTADCNANQVPDNCDIANGTSQDTDGNGIPDECDNPCEGDADGDGDSDVDDLLAVLGDFGNTGSDLPGDVDNDGDVDVDDVLQVLSVFGSC
ncbi:MAG: hypothetical protein CMJ39_00880 [Phycisphaerae bacterium]|nr:hypothetical protein [Phycisphaerae bacterium]